MVYPDKPSPTQPWRVGTGSYSASREKKFRVGKNPDDGFWQENIENRLKSEHDNQEHTNQPTFKGTGSNRSNSNTREQKINSSYHSDGSENAGVPNKEYVHHPGFQGSTESVSTALKYKFGKKKAAVKKEQSSQPATFKPKGFGSLYDELEFERRYKKVFDLNKHIHFVHSNFVTGQRIYKRNKLPPIGHIPSIQSDPTDGQDIFAIMSVQRFNHPDGCDPLHAPVRPTGNGHKERHQVNRAADGFPARTRHNHKRHIDFVQEINAPPGFVPEPVKPVNNSPFDGVKGNVMPKEGQSRLSMASHEDDSALGTLTEETYARMNGDDVTCTQSEASVKTFGSKKTKLTDEGRLLKHAKKKYRTTGDEISPDYNSEQTIEDPEPFNISVHVEIKPKDPSMNGGDDIENERARERRLPLAELPETPENHEESGHEGKVLYATKNDNVVEEMNENGEKVMTPKSVTTTRSQYGLITQKVQYPEKFNQNSSIVSDDT
ncbi:hypothetical protein ACF0H5_014081 [Mactra antiquata]